MAAPSQSLPDAGPNTATTIAITARFVRRTLWAVIAFLVVMHTTVHVAYFGFGHDHVKGLTPLFDMNRENNVPAWYSGTVFLASAAALGVIAAAKHQQRDPFRRHWLLLSLIFAYLSFDELTSVHENWGSALNEPLAAWRQRDVVGGVFRNLWVIPAGLVAAVVGVGYLRFLVHLPAPTRRSFITSGVTFVFAAVGMEMIGASYSAAGGRNAPGFMVLVTIEEGLEMASIALFLDAVLTYAARLGDIHVRFRA